MSNRYFITSSMIFSHANNRKNDVLKESNCKSFWSGIALLGNNDDSN